MNMRPAAWLAPAPAAGGGPCPCRRADGMNMNLSDVKLVRLIFLAGHTKTQSAVSILLKEADSKPHIWIQEPGIMSRNGEMNGNMPLFLTAGLGSLFCVPVIYLATRPVVWLLHMQWIAWLLAGLFILVPLAVTFIILYRSGWHEDSPKFRRILTTAFSSCVILGVDLIAVGALVAAVCLIIGLTRVVGGN